MNIYNPFSQRPTDVPEVQQMIKTFHSGKAVAPSSTPTTSK